VAYPPRVKLSLPIDAYCTGTFSLRCTGTFSSRTIAAQLDENVAFRVLAGWHRSAGEWDLGCLALNLRRMAAIGGRT
jgi:hypothetical protein